MSASTALRLAAWGVCVAVALQVVFYFVFQAIGYDSFLLSLTLLISLVVALLIFASWEALKRLTK